MKFKPLSIHEACLIEPEPIGDSRGSFARNFCVKEFAANGLATEYVQHSLSRNALKGTLRGMHFQMAPHQEAKLVWCTRGAIFDVCLDLRPASSTYLKWEGYELSAENGRQLYIPRGCAHGFQTLTDDAEIFYRISDFYAPEASTGVRFDDRAFGIEWPLPVTVMSDKDKAWPDFTP
jgi:dTDP-4-dehydrorhamnose 3,5-epimerase